ncbi:MAG: hypothetical protein GXP40_06010 [Chloroflexi bacterium]|nr:hypothetical protein [Chloroflexota bacterium]
MLIIISDVHLGDGTCGRSISADAFHLFADRLKELAYNASWRQDDTYRPIEEIDILLLGDILDPLHSTLWLDTVSGAADYVRPWTDTSSPSYAKKLGEITRAILAKNAESVDAMRRISRGEIVLLPPAAANGQPDVQCREWIPVEIRLHYMVGNHDWYYHIPGKAYDAIRQEIVDALGLANSPACFPYEIEESDALQNILSRYGVYARHGDCFDSFNFDKDEGRLAAALGDVFAVEMLNRFPFEIERRLGDVIPPAVVDNLRELTNVRPALATPLWISGQIIHSSLPRNLQDQIKAIWDELGDEFLNLDVVRAADKWLTLDSVDALELILKFSSRTSFKTINDIVVWVREKLWGNDEVSFAEHALQEQAFLEHQANYIVYGHTHHHEIVSLDTTGNIANRDDQIYFNSGTWHTYYDLATHKPSEQKFVPYQVLSYLAFYRDGERRGRRFETWTGAFS